MVRAGPVLVSALLAVQDSLTRRHHKLVTLTVRPQHLLSTLPLTCLPPTSRGSQKPLPLGMVPRAAHGGPPGTEDERAARRAA